MKSEQEDSFTPLDPANECLTLNALNPQLLFFLQLLWLPLLPPQ